MEFQDIYSRWHDKPVQYERHIPSNNGWIYSAIGKHLGFTTIRSSLTECYHSSRTLSRFFKVSRSPDKITPPLSKDELVGMISLLNIPFYYELKKSYFQHNNLPEFIPKPLSELDWFKVPSELWSLRNAHRNEIWKNSKKYRNAIHLAFRLTPDYTYFVQQRDYLRGYAPKPSFLHKVYFYIATYISLKSDRTSTKNIRFVMLKELKMEDSFLFKMIDIKKQINDYFIPEHPFVKKVNNEDS